jgi:hypothetical protein
MREIFARIAAHTDEYLARLKRACAQPSISAQGEGLAEMADLVAEMLRDVGRSVELVPTGGAPVVLGQMQGWGTLFVPQILQIGPHWWRCSQRARLWLADRDDAVDLQRELGRHGEGSHLGQTLVHRPYVHLWWTEVPK